MALEQQNKMLKEIIDENKRHNNLHESDRIKLSKVMIKNYVNEFLENEEINIDYLPDFVERQIYINTFNIFINLIHKVLENTKINFMNHDLVFDLVPESD